MPPKAKFSREEIINAALEIVRREGIKALTARELGAKLGSSARPVFTVFENMEEVQKETVAAARALYDNYVAQGLTKTPAFKGVGTAYIRFAQSEPKLFQLLFMSETPKDTNLSGVLAVIDGNYRKILSSVEESYGLAETEAEKLYRHLWIYTHGIATLCATKVCSFGGEEIGNMLTEVCSGVLQKIKSGEKK